VTQIVRIGRRWPH